MSEPGPATVPPPFILIVEDSLTQRMRLLRLLEKNGFSVKAVADGPAALALIETERPGLVVSDIRMPGMDGFELCRRIRSSPRGRGVPVTLLTALSAPLDLLRALDCGADHLLVKPFAEPFFLRQVAMELGGQASSAEAESGDAEEITVNFAGDTHPVRAGRRQILSLLLSTYESAMQTSRELLHMHEEYKSAQVRLRQAEQQLLQAVANPEVPKSSP